MKVVNPFQELGLDISSFPDMADLKKAYRQMAKKYHPDRFDHDPALKCKAEEKMTRINLAFQVASQYLKTCPGKDRNSIKVETEKSKKKSDSAKNRYSSKKYDKEYRQKRDILLSRFFSWCRNIMGPANVKAEQSGKKPSYRTGNTDRAGNTGNADHVRSGFNPEPNSFAEALKKSSESLKNIMNDSVKNQGNDKISQTKRIYESKKKTVQSAVTSYKSMTRKKKKLNSYTDPIEKVSPVSRVPKI